MRRLLATLIILLVGTLVLMVVIEDLMSKLERRGLVQAQGPGLRVPSVDPTILTLLVAVTSAALAVKITIGRNRVLGIPIDSLNRHVIILGRTGSGKTSVTQTILKALATRGVAITIIDWKGEYVAKIRGATVVRKVNLLEPPDWSRVQIHSMTVVDILRDVLQLTEPMTYMLYEELSKMYEARTASFEALLRQLRARRTMAIAYKMGAEANIAEGLIRRILPLVLDEGRRAVNFRGDGRVVIYDLSELPTYQLKTLYAEIILWRTYNEALRDRSHTLRRLVVAEEAQNYVRPRRFDDPPGIGERVVNELRAFGVGIVMIAPDPDQLPHHLTKDVAAVVSMGLDTLPRHVFERIMMLYRGEGLERLVRKLGRGTIVYTDGKLSVKPKPKPFKREIILKAEASVISQPPESPIRQEEEEEKNVEGAERQELRLEEEEEDAEEQSIQEKVEQTLDAGPRGGPFTLLLRSGPSPLSRRHPPSAARPGRPR